MSITDTIKYYLLRTVFAKVLRNIQARIQYARIPRLKSAIERKTVYCISPFKTGTTYLASCFNPEISQHEPFHHLTLKMLEKDFDSFFARRMKHLNLKLECSGTWSAYVNELIQNEIAKDLEYICILRTPSSWVSSVINYWQTTQTEYKYEYVNELFWKKKVGVDLFEFQIGLDTRKNQEIIDKLIRFYMDFTNNTRLLKNVTYIKLKEVDKNLPSVESLINESSTKGKRWKRAAQERLFTYENNSVDKRYEQLITELINERNTSNLTVKI